MTIPAATLVLFRDGEGGPQHLFVERSASMAFAAGAVVFPGGRIDPGDHAMAARFPSIDPEDAAGRVAAIRETLEETGASIGIDDTGDPARVRARLGAGADFGTSLDAEGLSLDVGVLVPFARWCPNSKEARTFDTRFYAARAEGSGRGESVDATENVRLFWATAAEVLSRAGDGQLTIIFPTRRNLELLATLSSFADLSDHAAQHHPVETITPWIEDRDGEPHLCIPPHLGYPVSSEPLASVRRG